MKHKRKGINISHVNIENMGVRDQSQMKNKSLKSSKKSKSVPKDVPKSHNDDNNPNNPPQTQDLSATRCDLDLSNKEEEDLVYMEADFHQSTWGTAKGSEVLPSMVSVLWVG